MATVKLQSTPPDEACQEEKTKSRRAAVLEGKGEQHNGTGLGREL